MRIAILLAQSSAGTALSAQVPEPPSGVSQYADQGALVSPLERAWRVVKARVMVGVSATIRASRKQLMHQTRSPDRPDVRVRISAAPTGS